MAYQHPLLGAALGWKFNHQEHMMTRSGTLTEWPTKDIPADEELAQWVAEYQALPVDSPVKDIHADRLKRVRAATTIADLKSIIEELI